jgi:glycosyltransferase involved in cell wall biosynthesis
MKLACVVHRFGADIAGGSEAHCRHIAERLAGSHDITVLTTCARDHVTWRNEHPPGEAREGPLRVRRFPVARQRSLQRFRTVSEHVFSGRATEREQIDWFRENGPDAPELVEYLGRHGRDFDLILFWAFRYAEVFFGLPAVAERAVLVPTAEEDPLIRIGILPGFFARPAGFIFLTPEEQALVARQMTTAMPPSCVIGSGLEPAGTAPAIDLASLGIRPPFLLYLGRIDPNKGCTALLKHFARFAQERSTQVQLVMAGPANMPIPDHPAIRPVGFVDEARRDAILAQASVLVVPSRYESLSLALLEGWNRGLPALVNRHCAVLKGQVSRANGGLYYGNYDEFAHTLSYLLEHRDEARDLGRKGLAYVEREYRWPHVMEKIETLLGTVHARRIEVTTAARQS